VADAVRAAYAALLSPHLESARAVELLARYAALLERWAAVHSLVRFGSREELVRRHLLDSIAAAPRLGEAGTLADVGSGAGLPGVPLLAVRPGWRGVLLEPRTKRWAFLRLVIRELGLNAEAVAARIGSPEAERGPFEIVTARALGHHADLLAWSRPRLAPGGAVLLWLTETGLAELREVPGWRVVSSPLPGLDRGRLAQLQPCST
jgi:16S rRNA (guanine527-N7)-methyltransferase